MGTEVQSATELVTFQTYPEGRLSYWLIDIKKTDSGDTSFEASVLTDATTKTGKVFSLAGGGKSSAGGSGTITFGGGNPNGMFAQLDYSSQKVQFRKMSDGASGAIGADAENYQLVIAIRQ